MARGPVFGLRLRAARRAGRSKVAVREHCQGVLHRAMARPPAEAVDNAGVQRAGHRSRGTRQPASRETPSPPAISASFAVHTGSVVTITSPTGGEAWRRGSAQVIRWTLSAPVGAGRFTVWASSPSGDLTQLTAPGSPVTPVAGSTDYQWSYAVALSAAATYQILVRYEADAGETQSEARSSGRVSVISGTRISVMKPSGALTTWRRGSNQAVRWKLSEPVTAGVFRLWAVSAKGTRYRVTRASTPVNAVAGATSYSARWKVNAPPGKGYRIVVEYWSGAKTLASGQSTGRLTIKR